MKINNRQQVFAIAAAALVGFFVIDKIILGPLTASWKERSARIAELHKQINKGTETLKNESKSDPNGKTCEKIRCRSTLRRAPRN